MGISTGNKLSAAAALVSASLLMLQAAEGFEQSTEPFSHLPPPTEPNPLAPSALSSALQRSSANSSEPGFGGSGGPPIPSVEWEERQEVDARLRSYGADIMGDGIDPNTGSIQFNHIDVSIPGNSNLEVAIRRRRSQGLFYDEHTNVEFGDWELVVPRMHAVNGHQGWTGNRCANGYSTNFPPITIGSLSGGQTNAATYDAGAYAEGVVIDMASGTMQVLENKQGAHWPSQATHVTTEGWYLTCGSASDGDQGFVAYSTSGDKYTFDTVVVHERAALGSWGGPRLNRKRTLLAASRVEDVHGNWVEYDYDTQKRLTAIRSNDGRLITLSYSGSSKLVSSVSANGRTWTYSYSPTTYDDPSWLGNFEPMTRQELRTVTLPDGQGWSFQLDQMNARPGAGEYCANLGGTLTVTHPYGMTGTFVLAETRHRRSFDILEQVIFECPREDVTTPGPGETPVYDVTATDVMAVVSKTLSGPDTPTATWSYQYEQDNGAAGSSSSDRTNFTIVTEPTGAKMKYYHLWGSEPLGNKLVKKEVIEAGNNAILQTTQTEYNLEGSVGSTFMNYGAPAQTLYRPARMFETIITRGPDEYTTRNTYDSNFSSTDYSWGAPIQTDQWSNISGGYANRRMTEMTYEHKTSKWILSLPKTTRFAGVLFDSFDYDAFGRLTDHDRFGSDWATFGYYTSGVQAGRLHWRDDVTGRRTSLANYKRGIPQSLTRPDNVVLSRVVDDNGWITSSTNARGYTVGYGFNDVGWLTNIDMYGSWSDTTITYSDLSNGPRQIINRGPERTTTDYDAYLRPILERRQAVSAGGGNIYMSYEYDGLGRKVFESWPSLTSLTDDGVETSYDALGRPLTQRENVAPFATTSYQFLSLNRTVMTDPVNSVTTTKYSGYGSPEDGDPIEVTDPLNTKTQMTYDIYGNLKTARQFGSVNGYSVDQTQRWYYDSRYRLCRHSVPETGDTIYNYDTLDRLTRRIPGQTSGSTNCPLLATSPDRIEYEYDDLDRLEFVDFPDTTPDITHTYDANGNVIRTQRGVTDWTYTYNTLDLPRIERLKIDGRTYQSVHGYNAAGHETSVTFPDGKKTAFHPDAFGRPKRVIDANSPQKTRWADSITYFANGRVSNVSYHNGHALSQMQNARQLVSGIDVRSLGASAQVAVDLTYDYDSGARITAIDDNLNAGWDRTFGYDAASRLTSATGPWGSGATAADYKYDALGNIRRKQVGSRVIEMQYDSRNRLRRFRDSTENNAWQTLAYDARGNVRDTGTSAFGGVRFTYDRADQPVSMIDAATGSFVYDGNLKRAKQTINGKTIYTVYSESGSLMYRDNITDNERTSYVGRGTGIRIVNGQPRYTHKDHLGSPIAETDASGNVVWKELYTPFGLKWTDPAANRDNEGYTGHIEDGASGLTYMQARYYDPALGRFLANDPVGFADGGPGYFNRYSYTLNNPMSYIDPNGMCGTGTRLGDNSSAPCRTIAGPQFSARGGQDSQQKPANSHGDEHSQLSTSNANSIALVSEEVDSDEQRFLPRFARPRYPTGVPKGQAAQNLFRWGKGPGSGNKWALRLKNDSGFRSTVKDNLLRKGITRGQLQRLGRVYRDRARRIEKSGKGDPSTPLGRADGIKQLLRIYPRSLPRGVQPMSDITFDCNYTERECA